MEEDDLLRFLQAADARASFRPSTPKKECNCAEKCNEILTYLKRNPPGGTMGYSRNPAWVLAAAGVTAFTAGVATGLAARRRAT